MRQTQCVTAGDGDSARAAPVTNRRALMRGFDRRVANQLLVHELLDTHVAEFAPIAGVLDTAERHGIDRSVMNIML